MKLIDTYILQMNIMLKKNHFHSFHNYLYNTKIYLKYDRTSPIIAQIHTKCTGQKRTQIFKFLTGHCRTPIFLGMPY